MDDVPRYLTFRIPLRVPRLRISLRCLVAGVTAISISLGYLAHKQNQARIQRSTVTTIFETGGSVCYSGRVHYRLRPNGQVMWAWSRQPPAGYPRDTWFRSVLGRDFFDTVTSVTIGAENVLQATNQLGSLPNLKMVVLRDVSPSEIDAVALSRLSRLRKVVVKGKAATPELVSKLKRALPNVELVVRTQHRLLL